MSAEKPLPCPFCGGEPSIRMGNEVTGYRPFVMCGNQGCPIQFVEFHGVDFWTEPKQSHIEQWNTRKEAKRSTPEKIIAPTRSVIPDPTCQCGHPPEKHIECVDFISARGCFADDCDCNSYRRSTREIILGKGWNQGTPVSTNIESPLEWWRKPPSGRWLFVRRQSSGIYTWHVWSRKPTVFPSARVLATSQASTPELAMAAADQAESTFAG